MTEQNADVFEQVADMIVEEDVVGGPKTAAFIKLMSLQFSKAEARLALKVRTAGGTLDELVERTGMQKGKLESMLYKMADKGTVFYDPALENPNFRVVQMGAPGFSETGVWGGIKHSNSVAIAKTLHTVVADWMDEKILKLGVPVAPVWAAVSTLPEDADPSENLAEVIKDEGHWSVSACPCRMSQWIAEPGNHCDHMLEACIHTGEQSRWAVKHGMARELTYDGLRELLDECNEDGLVHTLNIQNSICNCCHDCCGQFRGPKQGIKIFIPSPFVPEVDEEACNACGRCELRCPMDAIELIDDCATVDLEDCIGCAVCVTSCKVDGLRLVRRAIAA